jgi:YVTN family beta-propeller protein
MKPSKMSMLSLTKMSMLSLTKMPMLSLITFVILLCLDGSVFAQRVVASIPVGIFPVGVAVNRLTNRVYVANLVGEPISPFMEAPNTVTVIDGASNRVVGEIVTGLDFQIGLAVDEVRNVIYVATLDNGVDVLDGKTDEVITNIPVAGEPVYPGINAFTKSVYVSNQIGWLSVLDEKENNIVATIQLGGGPNVSEPEGVAVDPITNRVYVADFEPAGSVWVVDGRTNTLVATVPVGDSPFGIAVNLLTRRVYVANAGENKISVIEARTNNVIANVPVAGNPVHVAVDELRNRIYSCNIGKNGSFSLLSIINGGNNGVLATVPLAGAYCGGLALNMFTNLIYFTDENTDSVTVIRGTRR